MTYWFSRLPGQMAASCVSERPDEHLVFVGVRPDWVEVPNETPHPDAGKKLRTGDTFRGPCPSCQRTCLHYAFEASKLHVAECTHGCAFVWYQLREPEKETQDDARTSDG